MVNPSSKPIRAATLAIGTELAQGQITNRNATWIGERLTSLGYQVVHHWIVPDDRSEIETALEYLAARCELLVVTGGLGPTTDDFTRECVAKWMGAKLEFREESWLRLRARLESRKIEVAESNRVQCFFPTGTTVLENGEGTADGFTFCHVHRQSHQSTQVLVLPGPPREGQHLWDRFAASWLHDVFGELPRGRLHRWNCLGKSESSLGEIVENAVQGYGVQTGYRASVPYVEVKIWIPPEYPADRELEVLARLESAIGAYSVVKNGGDLAQNFLAALADAPSPLPIHIFDFGTNGILTERIVEALKSPLGRELQPRIRISTHYSHEESAALFPGVPGETSFGLFSGGEILVLGPYGRTVGNLPTPYSAPEMKERLRRFHTEMALRAWTETLRDHASRR